MTNKKEKLRQLLERLNSLESKGVLPMDEIDGLTKDLISEEVAKFTNRLKDNSMVTTLEKFRKELNKFKTDFDLKPITKQIQELQDEIEQSEKELVEEFEGKLSTFEDKLNKVKSLIPKLPESFDPYDLIQDIENLKSSFEKRLSELNNNDLKQKLDSIQKQFNDFASNEAELRKLDKKEVR